MNLEIVHAQNQHLLELNNKLGKNYNMNKIELSPIREFRKEQYETLFKISNLLNTAIYTDSLIEQALDLAINVIRAERGIFVRYDFESSKFSVITARNINKNKISNLEDFSSGILQQVVEKKQACLYHDVQGDPTISQFESVQIHKIKSVIGVPVFYEKKIWGVLLVDSQQNRQEFTEENLIFLEFFANLVSLVLDKIIRTENLQDENLLLRKKLEEIGQIPEMIGESRAMKEFANLIHRVAQTDATVLILGESGTGKELAARAIHKLSQRTKQPFLAQFCGSIPDTLLESELFGYKKGAFTGANTDKKGMFEIAHNGTFFLDEIGDISIALQAKLLRVLQNQEIMRLGDIQVKKVNVRIIAATNKDLAWLTKESKFREDLFYRLNVFPITVPPLRERKGDITLLIKYFLKKYSKHRIHLNRETIKKMENFWWPGNVRQLENVLQRALILCDSEELLPEHVILEDQENLEHFKGTLKDFEMKLLNKRLKEFDGNKTRAAKSLGVSVRWIQLKMKKTENKN
jgi:Nif-specific regulatory protein